MKSESEIRNKLKEVKYRYLKKNIKQKRKHIPQNCTFNAELVSSKDEANSISICVRESDDEWVKFYGKVDNKICDLNYDGKEKCVKCPFFSWDSEKEDIKQDFDRELLDLSAAQLAFKYPEIMALSWVLDNSPDVDPLIIKEPEVFPDISKEEEEPDTLFRYNNKTYLNYIDFLNVAPVEDKMQKLREDLAYWKTNNLLVYFITRFQLFCNDHLRPIVFTGAGMFLFLIVLFIYEVYKRSLM